MTADIEVLIKKIATDENDQEAPPLLPVVVEGMAADVGVRAPPNVG